MPAMAEIFPDRLNSGRPPGKIRWRTLAMIIMITGAAGFAVALVFYNELIQGFDKRRSLT